MPRVATKKTARKKAAKSESPELPAQASAATEVAVAGPPPTPKGPESEPTPVATAPEPTPVAEPEQPRQPEPRKEEMVLEPPTAPVEHRDYEEDYRYEEHR